MRTEIIEGQRVVLEERRDEACAALRAERDLEYRALLDAQKDSRTDLLARQEEGLRSPQLGELGNREPERQDSCEQDEARGFPEADAGTDVRRTAYGHDSAADQTWQQDERMGGDAWEDEFPSPMPPVTGVRPGLDIGGNLGMGMVGGLAAITESLFDGFFGASPTKGQQAAPPRPPPAPSEFPRHNPFAAVAEEARRNATVASPAILSGERRPRSRSYSACAGRSPQQDRHAPFAATRSRQEANVSLENRPLPRQLLYLLLAFIGFVAASALLAAWLG